MSNSTLASATYIAYSGNYTRGRSGRKIETICLHHMAGKLTAKQCGAIFQKAGRNGSANYGIGYDGEIALYVDEANTAWANSNWDSNCKSVSIEVSNDTIGGNWHVSDKSLDSLIKLVADIAKRNGLGTLVRGKNFVWHSLFKATTCPGPYLLSKIDYIIEQANAINNKPTNSTSTSKSNYTRGNYKCLYNMKVRNGVWGTNKKVNQLTADGRKNATSKLGWANAVYKAGTVFTAKQIINHSDGSVWAVSPSGYICIKDNKQIYCQKI